jgi:DNA-binding Lrp family transcriptional regulator
MRRTKTIQFERLLDGPEAKLQGAVEAHLSTIFPRRQKHLALVLGSLTLGAGRPDILLASFDEHVTRLSKVDRHARALLPYLQLARPASAKTLARRLGLSVKSVDRALAQLVEARIATQKRTTYSLSRRWQTIIPDIVAVEIKVGNWRRGLSQAARNRIFAHRSYLGLPETVARRVKTDKLFRTFGVGIIGIAPSGRVHIVKAARRTRPKVWSYYFALASEAASHLSRSRSRAIRRANRGRKGSISRL